MNKKLILLGSFLAVILMVTTPMIQGINTQNRSSRLVSILSREKNTIVQTDDKNQTMDIAIYKYKENERIKSIKTFDKKIIDDIQKDIEEIEQLNITRFEKINLTYDIFIEYDILTMEDKKLAYENNLKDIHRLFYPATFQNNNSNLSDYVQEYSKNELSGVFGSIYGSFSSNYDDEGYVCLAPFPLLNVFPMVFGGFGFGDIYFTNLDAPGGLTPQPLHYTDFVFLISLFFVGTVILLPFVYYGFQGYILGFSIGFWGAGI